MSYVISEPGFYRQRNGGKAEVFGIRNGWAVGFDSREQPTSWLASDGDTESGCSDHLDITGPWHEPQTPSFRISDHGVGIYESRDGQQVRIVRMYGCGWTEHDDIFGMGWYDDGRRSRCGEDPRDLVRYIGPLPEPQPKFKVGDTVLVNYPSSNWHKHYGTVRERRQDHGYDEFAVVLSNDDIVMFEESELSLVTLPAPLPDGYRLLPRNVKPSIGCLYAMHDWKWGTVRDFSYCEKSAEGWDAEYPKSAPYFFAEPIPKSEPWVAANEWSEVRDGMTLLWVGVEPPQRERKYTRGSESEWRAIPVGPGT